MQMAGRGYIQVCLLPPYPRKTLMTMAEKAHRILELSVS